MNGQHQESAYFGQTWSGQPWGTRRQAHVQEPQQHHGKDTEEPGAEADGGQGQGPRKSPQRRTDPLGEARPQDSAALTVCRAIGTNGL